MIPQVVADLAQLLADWNNEDSNDEYISQAYWLIQNLNSLGHPINV